MMAMSGALNSRGFSSSMQRGVLPDINHITYEGVFNQLKFDVGNKTEKLIDLHFGYARYQFSNSLFDRQINNYLSVFFKSSKDGADRSQKPINATLCLDVSGSMNGNLKNKYQKLQKTRLSLSLEAIKMFISKLRPNDSVALLTFNNEAKVLIPQTKKSQFNMEIFHQFDKINANGGTTIAEGINTSVAVLDSFLSNNKQEAQNRIIILTDVNDDSFRHQKNSIEQITKKNIHLTIIGISDEFDSSICQTFKNIKGFNYFCAVNDEDIKKYVFQLFDFVFFPVAHDIVLKISSPSIKSFQVYGSTDSQKVKQYNNNFHQQLANYTVTKLPSVFPSELQIQKDKVFTMGGLILMKIQSKSKQPQFKARIQLKYNLNQQIVQEIFQVCYDFPVEEQYFSEQALREALQGYAFVSQIRNILKQAKQLKLSETKKKYLKCLEMLKQIVPKNKLKELKQLIKILNEQNQIQQFQKKQ